MATINKERKKILTQLDNIIHRIQKQGSNGADEQEIFAQRPSKEYIEQGLIEFIDYEHPTKAALEYLIQEGLVYKTKYTNNFNRETYALTFKGILRTRPNTFVDEYENSIKQKTLVERDLKAKLFYNIAAITISLFALLISIFYHPK